MEAVSVLTVVDSVSSLSLSHIYSREEKGGIRGRTRGRRVTMPEPLGRKSRPTIFSRTELFPEDCEPMTTIWGRSTGLWTPTVEKASCSLLIVLMSDASIAMAEYVVEG